MNIDTKWMMKVFDDRQIRIVGWMGESIDGDRLELILADARSEELDRDEQVANMRAAAEINEDTIKRLNATVTELTNRLIMELSGRA